MVKLNADDVATFLKSAPATVGGVAAKFSVTKQTANRVLANMRKAGTVAVVSTLNKHTKGRPEFIYGVLASPTHWAHVIGTSTTACVAPVVEAPVAPVEAIDVPVVEVPMTDVVGPHGKLLSVEELADYSQPVVETKAFSFDDTDRP